MSELSERLAKLTPEQRALLTKRLQQKRAVEAEKEAIPRRENRDDYPISYAQQRLWFLDQFEPESPFYNISGTFRLQGPLNLDALRWSIDEIVRRHEVLRSNFVTKEGYPLQVIAPEREIDLPVTDLQHLSAVEQEAEVSRLVAEEAARPFNLKRDPLLRVSLLRLDPKEHVTLVTMHHIVSDGWSTAVFLQELAALYDAYVQERPSPLPELPIQYADYAHWQREWLKGETPQKQLAYWQRQLGSAPQTLPLPTDRPRPPIQTYHGAHYQFDIPTEIANAIKQLGRQEEATLFMTLLAAFQVLLYRYTSQESISVGAPVTSRQHLEVENLIGFFVNTVVLRADVDARQSFRAFLRHVRETALTAYANQDLPFEMLVETLQVERDMSQTPLFQVMFDLQSQPLQSFQIGDLTLEPVETEPGTAKFDLMLMAADQGDRLQGIFEYNTDLFTEATIARMAGHFSTLLAGIVDAPDRPLAALPMLTSQEEEQLLREHNDTAMPYPNSSTFVAEFEAQVERTPDETAVVFEDQALTYEKLNQRANQLAYHLRQIGVQSGEIVGLAIERSVDLLVGVVGILKAGGAYLPLDPTYPSERLAFMLTDAQVQVLVTQAELLDMLPTKEVTAVCIGRDWDQIGRASVENPLPVIYPESVGYVIYTSGSTGKPKGVMINDRAMLHLANALHERIYAHHAPEQRQRISLNAPVSFDASVQQIVMLTRGHTLYIIPQAVRQDGHALVSFIRNHRLHQLDCVPTQLKLLLEAGLLDDGGEWAPNIVMPGGEAIDEGTWQILREAPTTEFYNMYGPTECAVDSTVGHIGSYGETPTIGGPVPNARTYVLDSFLNPVPVGVPGELHIGGEGVARGYLNRSALTAEKFIPDPFTDKPGARMYRTGDLVRHLPEGGLEFLGRIDHQIKLHGYRMELGEIEENLREHEDVQDAIVMARDDNADVKRLVGYITPREGASLKIGSLRQFLKGRLPHYMIPSLFVPLDSFPLTPNGKIDRRALPAPEQDRPDLERQYVAPRNGLEQYIAEVWQKVLGIDRIGVHDNFFELGGNSIQAAVLINRFQDDFNETTHVRAIFLAPTVAELALYMREYYPDAVRQLEAVEDDELALEKTLLAEKINEVHNGERVTDAKVTQIRDLIEPLPPRETADPVDPNPPAVFILSPPRSGSTLLRVMLEGSPALFAPPELDLLSFNTLAERQAAFSGEYSFWLEGPVRAIMEIQGCDAAEAEAIMAGFEQQRMTTKRFYRQLQEWVGDRLLIDKTPVYPLDMNILDRAESDFIDARYIHLMRHPYASIYSFVEARLDKLFFRHKNPFSVRELAELVWIVSHQNILRFLNRIPAERQHRIRFESLVRNPQEVMIDLCRFLDIDLHPAMLMPYEGDKMTSGVAPDKQMVGDFKFYLRSSIDPSAADRWRKFHTEDFLSEVGQELAVQLGYEETAVTAPTPKISHIPRDGELPLSYAQQRLWFLDHLEPDSNYYNIPVAVRMQGQLNLAALRRSLNEIVQRHETLRTSFHTVNGKPTLHISSDVVLPLPVVDLTNRPVEEREAAVLELVRQEAQRPFSLSQAPLMRAALYRLAEDEHVVVLTMHHIISDGWSVDVLINNVGRAYNQFVAGTGVNLPDLPIQYVDYAKWQRDLLQKERLEQELGYWKTQLAGLPPLLELPTDRPRPALQSDAGALIPLDLSPDLSEKLRIFSQREGVTTFMTIMAAFQVLLYRYTGQDDIAVGTPVAGRNLSELEKLIGLFVNTLVIRTDLSGAPTFRELVQRVKDVSVAAFSNQDVPFEMVVDALQPQRNLSYTPLFQVMFAYQNKPLGAIELPDLVISPMDVDTKTAKFDLTLAMTERDNQFVGSLEFNTDLFDAATIERMITHLRTLLHHAIAEPNRSVTVLTMLPKVERSQLLVEWNKISNEIYHDRCIHQMVETQAARTPGAVALTFEQETLTYKELDERSNQLAHYLRSLGIGPESLVGVCVERSTEMVIGLLGIMKAGGAYVPLDPNYPEERLAFMMEDTAASVLLTQSQLQDVLPQHQAQVIYLDKDWPMLAQQPKTAVNINVSSDNLAYVLFTSGSTGRPKGVAITHRSVIALIEWARTVYNPEDWQGMLAATSINFDLSVFELFVTLSCGGQVILAENALQLPHLPAAQQVNFINTVPSAIVELLRLDGIPDSVSVVNLAGEPLLPHVVDQLYKRPSIQRVYDLYGPSEDTTYSTFALRQANAPATIGRPIRDTRLYLLDENMEPVPIGVPGEVYIGEAGLARGYLNRPALTAEKFIPDPFSQKSGQRLYRTGDLARFRPDGNIEFLGRIDHQIKLHGFRIELGEIKTILHRHPQVKDVVVMVREDTPGSKRLVAYIVTEEQPAPTVGELRKFLGAKLPDYMIPSVFVPLEALPLLPNGKVNRRALPAPDQERPELAAEYIAPRTPVEETLAEIWQQVLNLDQVGVHDNFFELGGDSILSIQIIARANQAGLQITPRQLFEQPTVAGLASVAGQGPVIEAEQGIVTGEAPLTPIQHHFFAQELPEPHHWNQAFLLAVQQKLDPALLATAVSQLLTHHDALRLRYTREDGRWRQMNAEVGEDIPFEHVDLSGLDEAAQRAAIEARTAALQASLDLVRGPLMRIAYFSRGNGRSDRLFLVIHHLAVDGVSWRILFEDLQTAYGQLLQELPVQLPPKTTSFRRWARRLATYAQSDDVQSELDYWTAVADQSRVLLVPDFPDGENTEASADRVMVALDAEDTTALLRDVPATYGTEINDALLTALVRAFDQQTGAPALLVDLEGHGREDLFPEVDISRTVGWFTTLFPVRLQIETAVGPGEALKAVKEQLRQIPRRGIGYGLLRYLHEDDDVRRQLAAGPAPVISFNYLGQFDQLLDETAVFQPAPESAGPSQSPEGRRQHLLDVNGSIAQGRLQMEFIYSQNQFHRDTVAALAEGFITALQDLITHCLSPDAGGYTPSDFPDVELSDDDLEAVMAEIGD